VSPAWLRVGVDSKRAGSRAASTRAGPGGHAARHPHRCCCLEHFCRRKGAGSVRGVPLKAPAADGAAPRVEWGGSEYRASKPGASFSEHGRRCRTLPLCAG